MWYDIDRNLILASQSPRRSDILKLLGFEFDIKNPNIENEEDYIDVANIEKSLQNLANAKAKSVAKQMPESLVLAGDTVVMLNNHIMGKPKSLDDAKNMIKNLSDKTHSVYTGIALICKSCNFNKTKIAKTNVTFRKLTDNEIDRYLKNDDYTDKAGAYGIQSSAISLVKSIDGCYNNVVGLPVSKVIDIFSEYTNFEIN